MPRFRLRRVSRFLLCMGSGLVPFLANPLLADQHGSDHRSGMMDHSAHARSMNQASRYTVANEKYEIPDIELLDQNGAAISLRKFLSGSKPAALNFIFTTCTTICPVMTATFSKMNKELGPEAKDLRLVSISIDPEYDAPRILKDYAAKFHAGENWNFLTGSFDDVVIVQKAFKAYFGDKMNHRPVTFFRRAGGDDWIRIDGLANGTDLANEYRKLSQQEEQAHHH